MIEVIISYKNKIITVLKDNKLKTVYFKSRKIGGKILTVMILI